MPGEELGGLLRRMKSTAVECLHNRRKKKSMPKTASRGNNNKKKPFQVCADLLYSACEGVIFTFCAVSGTNWFLLETIATFVVFSYLHCFCFLLCYRICCASGLKERYKWGSYASSSQEINLGEGKKRLQGETLHLRRGKKTVRKAGKRCSPLAQWPILSALVACWVSFRPCSVWEVIVV